MELARLFSRARETPLALRKLVPVLVGAAAQDDAETYEIRADRSPAAVGLDGATRSRLRDVVQAVMHALVLAGGQDEHGSGAHDMQENGPAVIIVSSRGAHAVTAVGRAGAVTGISIGRLERAPGAGRLS